MNLSSLTDGEWIKPRGICSELKQHFEQRLARPAGVKIGLAEDRGRNVAAGTGKLQ